MRIRVLLLLGTVAVLFCLGACGRKPDVRSRLAELEKAFPAAAEPAPTPLPSAQAEPANVIPASTTEANDLVRAAVSAARENDYAGGVIALEEAQRKPGLTADQVMAAQRVKQALAAELQNRAARGDPQALAQLKAIEKSRSQ